MSKQGEAKERQGYNAKVVPATCGNCRNCEAVMGERLMYRDPNRSEAGTHMTMTQTGQMCAVGNFSVNRLGWCRVYVAA
jgi:hypothetical protein